MSMAGADGPGRRRDCGGQGRARRASRLLGLSARTACDVALAKRRGKLTDAELASFHERMAGRYAELFGNSKGLLMKLGQMIALMPTNAVVPSEFHPIYERVLSSLHDDAPPMPAELARAVLESELGSVEDHFEQFHWEPIAAASVGQVHAARLYDGRAVAVKVQYPGAAKAIAADLKNLNLVVTLISLLVSSLPEPRLSVDLRATAREIAARLGEELDYRIELANQAEFADLYRGHPFIRVPAVVRELSTRRVLCQELVAGLSWEQALAASQDLRDRWAEAIWRFVYGTNARFGVLHADPQPGNCMFHEDGSVSFFDFGCVKRYQREQAEMMGTLGVPCVDGDVQGTWRACVQLGFLRASAPVTPEELYSYWREKLEMYWMEQPFRVTPELAAKWLERRVSLTGPDAKLARHWAFPATYTVMYRVEMAINAMLAQLHASKDWHAIADEHFRGAPPLTAMGKLDRDFFAEREAVGPK